MIRTSRILVTGATGFVGRSLIPHLAAQAHEITAATRRAAEIPCAARIVSDLSMGPATDWTRALDGIDVVVHLAALAHETHRTSDASQYELVNVGGTRSLAESAARAGVKRFVYLSTVKVMGEGTLGAMRPWRETDEPRPIGPYGSTKLAAERVVQDAGARAGMETVVLRPPVVYGPGLKANLLRLARAIHRGVPLPLGRADNVRSLVFTGNLADAIARCAAHPRAAGKTFFVADTETVSTAELARRIALHMGKKARLAPVPPRALAAAGALLGRRLDVERALASLVVDTSSIRTELEWSPPSSLDEGLAATVAWFERQAGAT